MSDFRVIQGNPCNPTLAPYIELIRREIHGRINSIYRGQDAARILHKHGKHTQAEIHRMYPGISNPPGRSTHELRGDGHAYGASVGAHLQWWQQGFDVNDNEVDRFKKVARRHGWTLYQPYTRGAEFHHLNFKHPPKAHGAKDRFNVHWLRARLPRS